MGMYYLFYEGEEWKLLIIIYNFRQELMVEICVRVLREGIRMILWIGKWEGWSEGKLKYEYMNGTRMTS
jgi:hypothetical protein